MVATKLEVFDALKNRSATAREVAEIIGADPRATEKLLNGLVSVGYLKYRDSRYELAHVSRKWLLKDSAQSLHDNMIQRFLEWEAVERFEDFVRTGVPLDVHNHMSDEYWAIYQRGMRSLAALSAPELARSLPVPTEARRMLDIGGSHGYYSATLCRRYPLLQSTVMDLPIAMQFAKPILEREKMGERVGLRAEDVLTADLGDAQWDFVLIAQLLHHFDEPSNQDLMCRVGRSLKPGGVVSVLEILRPSSPNSAGQTGALLDLYFAVVSLSGSWSIEELARWQYQANLIPQKPVRLTSIPGVGIQSAIKPANRPLPIESGPQVLDNPKGL